MIRVFKIEGDALLEVEDCRELDGAAGWIDLIAPTLEEDKKVEECIGISIPTKEDMQEIELSARLYSDEGADYMTMIAIAHLQVDDPVKTPITFIRYKNKLITVRYEELTAFSTYTGRGRKRGGVPVPSADCVMLDIIETIINRIADSLEILGGEMDGVSRDIFRSKNITIKRKTGMLQSAIRKVGGKGDLLGMIRESLSSIARLLSHYDVEQGIPQEKILRARHDQINRDVASLNDHAGFMAGKMAFLLDATLGMINLEQNQIIKIFSIAAVVFLPPTLVASIYGMNFEHMPELGFRFGYPMAIAAMIVSAIIPLLYFKKKGWL